ncbi:MAG: DUF4380 domain-containing protein [Armatimonadetes bacterium]|nr:DUF4380 domain-containing protein [Armatimonadota bacterium]
MLGVTLLCGAALAASGPLTVTTADYHGWSDAVHLRNGVAEVVVVPSLGRIMRFAPAGGDNFLWENPALAGKTRPEGFTDWFNAGGDKVWPAEQSAWPRTMGRGWPPDRALDGGRWQVELLPDQRLKLVSPVSADYGVRAERILTLADHRASLLIEQRFVKVSGAPVKVTIWNVSQTDDPELSWLPLGPSTALPLGYHDFERPDHANKEVVGNRLLEMHRLADSPSKYGTDSERGWVAAMKRGVVFSQHYARSAGEYPDHGCVAEVYTEMDSIAKMTELELLSPQATLAVGQSLSWTIEWRLTHVPANLERDELRSWLDREMGPLGWPYDRHATVNRRGTLY